MISSTALYNTAKHKGLRGPAHPTYGTSFGTVLGQTPENAYSRNSQKLALNHCIENVRFRYTIKIPKTLEFAQRLSSEACPKSEVPNLGKLNGFLRLLYYK